MKGTIGTIACLLAILMSALPSAGADEIEPCDGGETGAVVLGNDLTCIEVPEFTIAPCYHGTGYWIWQVGLTNHLCIDSEECPDDQPGARVESVNGCIQPCDDHETGAVLLGNDITCREVPDFTIAPCNHGTGYWIRELGFTNLLCIDSQECPDGQVGAYVEEVGGCLAAPGPVGCEEGIGVRLSSGGGICVIAAPPPTGGGSGANGASALVAWRPVEVQG